MKKLLFLALLFISTHALAQNDDEYWAKWNKNYPEYNIVAILKYEKYYADSVEKNPKIPAYYARIHKYQFQAEYLGKTRKLDEDVMLSMKRVFKLFVGDPAQLDEMCKAEALFKIGEEELWMPVQPKVLKALKNETHNGDMVNLYCLYFNEHSSDNRLFNTFLISEFKSNSTN